MLSVYDPTVAIAPTWRDAMIRPYSPNVCQRLVFVCVVLLVCNSGQARPRGLEGYQIVRVTIADEQQLGALLTLDAASRGFEIYSDSVGIGLVDVRISPAQKRVLDATGLTYAVLVDDLQRLYDKLFGQPRGGDFFDLYRTYDEHVAFLNGLVTAHPDLARIVNLGESVQGRPLWAIRITGPGTKKPAVFYHAAQHGNEIMGACVIAYAARQLLVNYDSDPTVAALVDNVELFLLPIMNPDGYESGDRHNANDYDLNRNWGGPGGNPNPFSQPETAAVRDFFFDHPNVRAHISLHSYGYMIMWPWGYTDELCEDDQLFRELGTEMRDRIFAVHGTDYDRLGPIYTTIYPVRGGTMDYCYGVEGQWAIVFEVGYAHYMPSLEIRPMSEELLPALLSLADWVYDCNGNGIADGTEDLADCNANNTPDECEPVWGEDFDGDGLTNACDPDTDDDGIPNGADVCDFTPLGFPVAANGALISDTSGSCVIELGEFRRFGLCLEHSGPDMLLDGFCPQTFDFNADFDIDLHDFSWFQRAFGP